MFAGAEEGSGGSAVSSGGKGPLKGPVSGLGDGAVSGVTSGAAAAGGFAVAGGVAPDAAEVVAGGFAPSALELVAGADDGGATGDGGAGAEGADDDAAGAAPVPAAGRALASSGAPHAPVETTKPTIEIEPSTEVRIEPLRFAVLLPRESFDHSPSYSNRSAIGLF